jgi:hypothetical protein
MPRARRRPSRRAGTLALADSLARLPFWQGTGGHHERPPSPPRRSPQAVEDFSANMQVLAVLPATAPALRARLAQLPPSGRPCQWWTPEVDIALLGGLQRCGLTAPPEVLHADKQLLVACWGQVRAAARAACCCRRPCCPLLPARRRRCPRPCPRAPPPRAACLLQAVATGSETTAPANPNEPPPGWPSADALAARCRLAVEALAEAAAAAAAAGPGNMKAAGGPSEGPGGSGPPAPPGSVPAETVPESVRWSKKDRLEVLKAVMVGG